MILISHRGNICGQNKLLENSQEYIKEALNLGFDVEIDVWLCGKNWFLGHDFPQHPTDLRFLCNNKFWIHCKNGESFSEAVKDKLFFNYFWHQNDDYALTSNGYLWTYPQKRLFNNSICVLPSNKIIDKCSGICADNISDFL